MLAAGSQSLVGELKAWASRFFGVNYSSRVAGEYPVFRTIGATRIALRKY